ncbi:MAG: phosphatidate cytidylyltransferase [Thioalkalispiraceae bacterium]|jgi:phosphatidate cytidylyltransferase
MLKKRVLTALILGPLIIWSVLALPHPAIAIEMGLILIIAAWEWARLSGVNNQIGRVGYALFVAAILLLLAWLMHYDLSWMTIVLYVVCGWWIVMLILIISANKKAVSVISHFNLHSISMNMLAGLFILSGAFVAVVGMHQHFEPNGAYYILMLLILIWIADSSAYFVGKAFGKHKLAVNVSPGKTWEGVIGGVVATLIAALIIDNYLALEIPQSIYFILIVFVSIIFSIVGDLAESLFKRRAGVKDSSQLLPGHGGILDRIDSLMSAAPVFLTGLLMAGIK